MSKDTIYREDAIKAVTGWETDPLDEELERAILNIPSADRPQGEWIENIKNVSDLIWHEYECDQCGELALMRHNFCPNCGADMRGADDGSC